MGVDMFGQDGNQNQWQQQGVQPFSASSAPQPAADEPSGAPAPTFSTFSPPAPTPTAPSDSTENDPTPALPAHGTVSNDDLLQIKQDALQQLSPLVSHLEQSPEEKFRTTMMMIQASDDHSLLQTAYETAKEISDEKVRAQALLDVINEINYFTQQHQA